MCVRARVCNLKFEARELKWIKLSSTLYNLVIINLKYILEMLFLNRYFI